MSPELVLFGSFALAVLLGFPISISLGIAAALAASSAGVPLLAIVQRMAAGLESFPLMAIPFFLLAGQIMVDGRIADRIVRLANALVGRFRGGLGMVNVVDSMLFGGISGSSVADVASLGRITIEAMARQGYDRSFAVALTVVTAVQAVIIPPSHNMVLYSLASGGTSVGRLFLGGVIPGLLFGGFLLAAVYITAKRRNYPVGERLSLLETLRAVMDGIPALMTGLIILGGILLGIFTATESAAIAVVYAAILTFLLYRDLPLTEIPGVLRRSLQTVGSVLLLIATSSAFGWMTAYLRVPERLTDFLLSLTTSPYVLLLLVNVMLLFLGMVMDMAPIILTVTPILMPVLRNYGIDPVHFGVVMMINLGIGLTTPPVGNALFTGCAIGQVPIEKAARELLPLWAWAIFVLFVVTYVPGLTLWLPNLLMPAR